MRKELSQIIFLSLILTLSACVKDSITTGIPPAPPEAIDFDAQLSRSQSTRAGYVGEMTTNKLKDTDATTGGFGVMACYTGTAIWNTWKSGTGTLMNFMYNQQVSWDDANSRWIYSPIKYWPNGTDAANANDSPSNTATEAAPQYLSFFAYAPYVEVMPSTGELASGGDNTKGIVGMTANTAKAEASYLTYQADTSTAITVEHPFPTYDPLYNVDLLWGVRGANQYQEADGTNNPSTPLAALGAAHNIDLTKQTVDERVSFLFKHALAKFSITVQGLFDHTDNDDASVLYPDDVDKDTKILIDSVSISPFFTEGKMYFAPATENASAPRWEPTASTKDTITIDGININATLGDTYKVAGEDKTYHGDFLVDTDGDTEAAKTNFDALPTGVTHTEVPLLNDGTFQFMVIPTNDYINASHPTTVRMVYYVITYDTNLTLNTPKFYSIVENDITATFDNFAFEGGKSYQLRLQPGLTTVKFEVSVDDWETPITLTPMVVEWNSKTVGEYNLDDSNTEDSTTTP